MARAEGKTIEKNFSDWSEKEKEFLLEYLEKKFFLIKKTTLIQTVLGTILACLIFLGGARAYINNAVSSEMSSLIASGARQELARLQEQARNDLANIDSIENSAKKSLSNIEATQDSLATGNLDIKSVSTQTLQLVDGAGHVKISFYLDKQNHADIDLLSDDNTPLVRLGTDGNQGNGLFVFNQNGQERMEFSLQTCDCATISLNDGRGTQRVILDVGGGSDASQDAPFVYLQNQEGVTISEMYEDDDIKGGAVSLFDNKGNLTRSLP